MFAVAVQEGLMEVDWPEELLTSGYNHEERDEEGNILYRGLRLRMVANIDLIHNLAFIKGIHVGVPLCQTDSLTGRMDYFGQMVNKSARIGAVAFPGQILSNFA